MRNADVSLHLAPFGLVCACEGDSTGPTEAVVLAPRVPVFIAWLLGVGAIMTAGLRRRAHPAGRGALGAVGHLCPRAARRLGHRLGSECSVDDDRGLRNPRVRPRRCLAVAGHEALAGVRVDGCAFCPSGWPWVVAGAFGAAALLTLAQSLVAWGEPLADVIAVFWAAAIGRLRTRSHARTSSAHGAALRSGSVSKS